MPVREFLRSLKAKLIGRTIVLRMAVRLYIGWIGFRLLLIRLLTGKRLLVLFRAGGLGDIISTLPTVAALRSQYPDRHLVFCTRPDFLSIAELVPEVDRYLGVYHGDAVATGLGRWIDARRLRYPDEFAPPNSTEHFIHEMAASVGVTLPPDAEPRIQAAVLSDDEFQEWFGEVPGKRPVVAIHLGPTAPVKEWPLSYWKEFTDDLRARTEVFLVQIGSGSHFLHGQKDMALDGALRSRRSLSLIESARLLKSCTCMVGVDSGPLHLAAAVGTRAIGIFGPVNPGLRLPPGAQFVVAEPQLPCQFCHHRTPRGHWETGCPHEIACMEKIQPAQLLEKVAPFLHLRTD